MTNEELRLQCLSEAIELLNESEIINGKEVKDANMLFISGPWVIKKILGALGNEELSLSEVDMDDLAANKNIGIQDPKEIEKVINSDDVIKAYKEYVNNSIDVILDLTPSNQIYFINLALQNGTCTKDQLKKWLVSQGYPKFKSDEECKAYMELKLANYNNMITLYINMIKANYKILGITASNANELINAIKSGDSNLVKSAVTNVQKYVDTAGTNFLKFEKKMRDKGVKNKQDIIDAYNVIYEGYTDLSKFRTIYGYDFSKIGGGIVIKNDAENLKFIGTEAKHILQIALKYDVTLDVHGGDMMFKSVEDKDGLYKNKLTKRWVIRKVNTPFGTFDEVNDLIRAAIAKGYKKIKIMSCNPGHYKLDKDILDAPDVIINHGTNSVLIESIELPKIVKTMYQKVVSKLYYASNYIKTIIKYSSEKMAPLKKIKFKKPVKYKFIEISSNNANLKEFSAIKGSNIVIDYANSIASITTEIEKIQKDYIKLKKDFNK